MSLDPREQAIAPTVEQLTRPGDTRHEPVALDCWPHDRAIPALVHDTDLRAMLGCGHSSYFKRKARGEFAFLELRPQLPGRGTVYSGSLVALWVAGDLRLRKAGPVQAVARLKRVG